MITRQGRAIEESSTSIRTAVSIGVDFVQVRRPDLSTAELEDWLRGLCVGTPRIQRRLIINSRWDLALALELAGVHLRESSMPIEHVRRFVDSHTTGAPPMLIGASRHSVRGVVEAYRAGADYVTLSPIFETASKPGTPPVGLAVLERACREVPIPVLALGGVGPEKIDAVRKHGAGGVAGIGLFADEQATRAASDAIARWKVGLDAEPRRTPS